MSRTHTFADAVAGRREGVSAAFARQLPAMLSVGSKAAAAVAKIALPVGMLRKAGPAYNQMEHKVSLKTFIVPVLSASLALPALPAATASAAPLPSGIRADDGNVLLVGRRGRHYRRHHRHGHGNGAAALFGAIIAGTLIAAAVREGRADERDLRRCDEDFPDFDYETGTYINRYGDERICPYLR